MNKLPIHEVLPSLTDALSLNDDVILEAEPGAGKTTVVPQTLLDQPWLGDQKIIMLEPRRLAARAAADRIAELLGEKVGNTVGYRVRQASAISEHTRIEVVTEGVFTRLLQNDPSLEGYGLIIFDEFHERSLEADLGLALSLEARSLFRDEDPFKILVMSATLEGDCLSQLLNQAPIVRSEGRSFPVDIRHSKPMEQNEWIVPRVEQTLLQALSDEQGSILCFLPGQREIQQVQERLLQQNLGEHTQVTPLYGNLPLEEQRKAIQPAPQGQRKIVLATTIAETSLTIEGVTVVVDSGLMRQSRFNPASAMDRLYTTRVSRASATQRAGRAGRTSPGVCYRLWSETQHAQLAPFNSPDIIQADLSALALQLAHWGISHPSELVWLDTPPEGAYQQALKLLKLLGAMADNNNLSSHGEQMCNIAAHPRLAHMLIRAAELGWLKHAALIAALLMEKDPLSGQADLTARIDWLNNTRNKNHPTRKRIHQQARAFEKQCSAINKTENFNGTELKETHPKDILGLLIALAYPDRIAKRSQAQSQSYKLSNGRGAAFFNTDRLNQYEWLAVASLQSKDKQASDIITLASPISLALVEPLLKDNFEHHETILWDTQSDQLIAEKQTKLGDLVLSTSPIDNPSDESLHKAIFTHLRKKGLSILNWSDDLNAWRNRVMFLAQNANPSTTEQPWPDLSDTALLSDLETWLSPYLSGISSLAKLKQLDYQNILLGILPWPLPQILDQQAPERFTVPSGSRIRIDYSQSPPVLAVKLQEMFGCTDTPSVAGVPLKLHLLSPAQRPLQVTQDLVSFWQNSYKDVQKDMKGRYPKHPWPDDPLTAIATAKTKKASR